MAPRGDAHSELVFRFSLADRLGVHIHADAGHAATLARCRAFFGLMQTDDAPAEVDCRLTDAPLAGAGYVFEQRYKGGRWRVMMDRLALPCRMHVKADRLGRAMVAQAGIASILRYLLGLGGVAWLHAATLVRDGRVVVLAGPSGVGKSQLVLRAVRDGWQVLTDDHTLIATGTESDDVDSAEPVQSGGAGIGGITTPVLVRSYGGWPEGLDCPALLARSRRRAGLLRRLTLGRVNLMSGFVPGPERRQTRWLPDAEIRNVVPCWLEPTQGQTVGVAEMAQDELRGCLDAGAQSVGRFMDAILAAETRGRCAGLAEPFWQRQTGVLSVWLARYAGAARPGDTGGVWRATIPREMNETHFRALWSGLNLSDG